jgi:hypothetical protein
MAQKYRFTLKDGRIVSSFGSDALTPDIILRIYNSDEGSLAVSDRDRLKNPSKIDHWNPETKAWETIFDRVADLDDLSAEIKGLLGESNLKHYRVYFEDGDSWTRASAAPQDTFVKYYRGISTSAGGGGALSPVVKICVLDDRGGSCAPYWKTVWSRADELDDLSSEIKGLVDEAIFGDHEYRVRSSNGKSSSITSRHPPEKFMEIFVPQGRVRVKPSAPDGLVEIQYLDGAYWKTIWNAADSLADTGDEIKSLLGEQVDV